MLRMRRRSGEMANGIPFRGMVDVDFAIIQSSECRKRLLYLCYYTICFGAFVHAKTPLAMNYDHVNHLEHNTILWVCHEEEACASARNYHNHGYERISCSVAFAICRSRFYLVHWSIWITYIRFVRSCATVIKSALYFRLHKRKGNRPRRSLTNVTRRLQLQCATMAQSKS